MKHDETSYLLKNPKNASRLLDGIEDYDNGAARTVEFNNYEHFKAFIDENYPALFSYPKDLDNKR